MSYNSGLVQSNVTLTSANAKGAIAISATRNSAGSSTLGTVPAGKRWIITSIELGGTTAAALVNITLQLNGVTYAQFYQMVGLAAQYVNMVQTKVYNYEIAPVIAATQTVVLTIPASCTGWAIVTYIEETV